MSDFTVIDYSSPLGIIEITGTDRGEFKHVDPQIAARHIIMLLEGIRVSTEVISINEDLLDEQFNFLKTILIKESDLV